MLSYSILSWKCFKKKSTEKKWQWSKLSPPKISTSSSSLVRELFIWMEPSWLEGIHPLAQLSHFGVLIAMSVLSTFPLILTCPNSLLMTIEPNTVIHLGWKSCRSCLVHRSSQMTLCYRDLLIIHCKYVLFHWGLVAYQTTIIYT